MEFKRMIIQRTAELRVSHIQEAIVSVLASDPPEGLEAETISEVIGIPAYTAILTDNC